MAMYVCTCRMKLFFITHANVTFSFFYSCFQLAMSDLSGGSGTEPQRLVSVCATDNPLTHQFSLQYNSTHAVVTIGSGTAMPVALPFSAGTRPLLLTIGNTPGGCYQHIVLSHV